MSEEAQNENPAAEAENAAGADQGEAPADNSANGDGQGAEGAEQNEVELPEAYRGEDGKPDFAKIAERLKAADAEPKRAEGVPESADGYELALAEEVKLPNGEAVTLDKDNELLQSFLKDAHAAGMPQEAVTRTLTAFAKEVGSMLNGVGQASQEQINAEMAKIDSDPKQVEARWNALTKQLGETLEIDGASKLLEEISSAESFTALEAIVERLTGTGGRSTDGGKTGKDALATFYETPGARVG